MKAAITLNVKPNTLPKAALLAVLIAAASTTTSASTIDRAIAQNDEVQFLHVAGREWSSVGASTYQAKTRNGIVQVAFGDEALARDLNDFAVHRERIASRLAKSSSIFEQIELQSSLDEIDDAVRGTIAVKAQGELAAKSVVTNGQVTLSGCGMFTQIKSTFDVFPSIILGFSAKIEAIAGGSTTFASMGNLQLTAIANEAVSTKTGALSVFYGTGSRFETTASGSNWECAMETRASLTNTCASYSGYRSVVWRTSCANVLANTAPVRTLSYTP